MTGAVLWTAAEAAQATQGELCANGGHDWAATGISIDTRTLEKGDLFVALVGDNRDGHAFVADAFARGAAGALVSRAIEAKGPLLVVEDTLRGLEALARAARRRARAKVAAVTGSVGKTGTKEALRAALSALGPTHASVASYNNQWGVPLSLARMPADCRYAVFEIGMNHAGEIAPLARLAAPNVAVITTVEPVHLAYFPTVEAIAEEKGEIFAGLALDGVAVINRDNAYFGLLRRKAEGYGAARVLGFGVHPEADARLIHYEPDNGGSVVTAMVSGEPITFRLGAAGQHVALNSLAVLASVAALGGEVERAAAALAKFASPEGRGNRLVLCAADGDFVLIDESYNANPASMRAALAVLGAARVTSGGRRIAVLGDMLELGQDAPAYHAGLVEAIDREGIDLVFACGPLMAHLWEDLPSSRRGGYATSSDLLAVDLEHAVRSGDVLMVKGSLGSRMARVVELLKTCGPNDRVPSRQPH